MKSAITLLLLLLFMSACSTDILRPDTSKVWQQYGMKNNYYYKDWHRWKHMGAIQYARNKQRKENNAISYKKD